MLKNLCLGCWGLLVVALLAMPVSADVVLSMDASGNRNVDTGTPGAGKLLSIYIAQESASSDTLFVMVADYTLQSGVVTGGQVSATGSTGTAGFYGSGNLSTSNFTPTAANSFNINQEITSGSQPLLNEPSRERWLNVEVDTSGLADGVYTINLLDPANTFADPGFNILGVNNDLTFTVSSVPEPGTLTCLGLATCWFVVRRRRKIR